MPPPPPQDSLVQTRPLLAGQTRLAHAGANHSMAGPQPPGQGPQPPGQGHVITKRRQPQHQKSSIQPGSAASSLQKPTQTVSVDNGPNPILYRELQQNYPPNTRWFESYDSLKKLRNSYSSLERLTKLNGKRKITEKLLLADLRIPDRDKDGAIHYVGLHNGVQKKISYLLDVEAKWNRVTPIDSRPELEGLSKVLWKGNLWLGGIKDSINEQLLADKNIDAVVTIHPRDWLAEKEWKKLFTEWNKGDALPQLSPTGTRWQYVIDLMDDSSSNLVAEFDPAFRFMSHFLSNEKNVLVHCKMGQSRSVSLVLGYMSTMYYKCCIANISPSARKPSEDFKKLEVVLQQLTKAISNKRHGVNTEKFGKQLEQHLVRLAKYKGHESRIAQQSKPQAGDKKGGGGIIKDAVIVLCYMDSLTPTEEIREYWEKRKDKNLHYWVGAAKDKTKKKGMDNAYYWSQVDEFFKG